MAKEFDRGMERICRKQKLGSEKQVDEEQKVGGRLLSWGGWGVRFHCECDVVVLNPKRRACWRASRDV